MGFFAEDAIGAQGVDPGFVRALSDHVKLAVALDPGDLEPVFLRLPCAEDAFTEQDFCSFLTRLLGFHEPLEDRIDHFIVERPRLRFSCALNKRRRSALLHADLKRLCGENGGTLDRLERARPCQLPALDSVSQLLGILYVMEGATLDGVILCRQLKDKIGLDWEGQRSFFQPYGAGAAGMWRSFLERMAAEVAHGHAQEQEIILAARQTLSRLGDWMDTSRHAH